MRDYDRFRESLEIVHLARVALGLDAVRRESRLPQFRSERLKRRSSSSEPANAMKQRRGARRSQAIASIGQAWTSRGHFFVAVAEVMRRILIENVRRKKSLKRGRDLARQDIEIADIISSEVSEDLLALDEALNKLAESDPRAAKLVELRYFSGLTVFPSLIGRSGVSTRTAD